MAGSKWSSNVAHSFREADEFNTKFWRKAGAAARLSASWSMVLDYLKAHGRNESQSRLRKTFRIIKRS